MDEEILPYIKMLKFLLNDTLVKWNCAKKRSSTTFWEISATNTPGLYKNYPVNSIKLLTLVTNTDFIIFINFG